MHTATYTCAGLFYGSWWLVDAVDKFADMLKVPGHLCGQHHVDNSLSQCPELIPVNIWREYGVVEAELFTSLVKTLACKERTICTP